MTSEAVLSRALHGVARPVFYKGEQVGEYREYDERLAMFLLRCRRPQRFGGWIGGLPAPEDWQETEAEDPALRLEGYLDEIEFTVPDDDAFADPEGDHSEAGENAAPAPAHAPTPAPARDEA